LTPEVYRQLAELTEVLRQGVREVCASLEVPVQVTGLGSLFGIHFTKNQVHNYRDVASGDMRLRNQVFLGLMNEGILTTPTLVGALSTAIGESEVDIYLDTFKRVLEGQL
jgi:glutamate-1-semialdehyde 2,1-aminomutase